MRATACILALTVVATTVGCVGAGHDQAATQEAAPLHGFAHLVGGEWTTILASGIPLRETWSWEPDGRSLRVVGAGSVADGTPWREEQVFFVDEATGEVRVRGSNSYRNGRFEGTVRFDSGTAEAQMVIEQTGWTRQLVRRWRFDGVDRFETELLEFIAGEGLVPLVSWTYTRSRESPALTPSR